MPVGNIPTHKELAVTFTGAVCFAFYLVTLGQTLRWQLFTDEGWKLRRHRNNLILTATVLIFVFTTIYIALGLYKGMENVYDAVYGHEMPGFVTWISTIGVSTDADPNPYLPINQILTFLYDLDTAMHDGQRGGAARRHSARM
jgi:hypothetical protein